MRVLIVTLDSLMGAFCYTPATDCINPRAKYSRKPAATIHSSGLISRHLPAAERTTTQLMKPALIPLAIE